MFEWLVDYTEPIILLVLGLFFLKIWSATELRKKEIEEDGKKQRSQINCNSKDAQAHNDLLYDLRALQDGGQEGDELGQMEAMLNIFSGNQTQNDTGVSPDAGVMSQLQEFAQTPDGAEAMQKFNSFQQNKGSEM